MLNKINMLNLQYIFIISIVLSNPLFADDPPYKAIITELNGSVQVKKSTQSVMKTAVWGMHLQTGDQIKTEYDAEVTILFASNNMITLGSNSSMTITDHSISGTKTTTVKTLDPDLSADLSILSYKDKDDGEIVMLAGLRSGVNEKIELVSPRNTKLKTRQPSFRWRTTGQYEKFKISVFNENGRLWTKETPDQFLNYPEDEATLEYNRSYFWYVEGENLLDSDKTDNFSFSIIDEDKSKFLSEREKQLTSQFEGSNFYFLIGNIYEKENLYEDALTVFRKISESHPTAPLPHRILGKIYQRIGLKDRAIEEMETAVELTQKQN